MHPRAFLAGPWSHPYITANKKSWTNSGSSCNNPAIQILMPPDILIPTTIWPHQRGVPKGAAPTHKEPTLAPKAYSSSCPRLTQRLPPAHPRSLASQCIAGQPISTYACIFSSNTLDMRSSRQGQRLTGVWAAFSKPKRRKRAWQPYGKGGLTVVMEALR